MKTDASRGNITGTAYNAFVTVGNATHETDMAIVASANKETYTVAAKASE